MGGTNVSCQLKFWLFVSCQLKFWPFVSCQLTPSRPSCICGKAKLWRLICTALNKHRTLNKTVAGLTAKSVVDKNVQTGISKERKK